MQNTNPLISIVRIPEWQTAIKTFCNTNNHLPQEVEKFGESAITENEYWIEHQRTSFGKWFPLKQQLFPKTMCQTVHLKKQNIQTLVDMSKSAILTGRLPLSLEDEWMEIVRAVEESVCMNSGKQYFVRTESASLKDGIVGAGPFTNAKQVLTGLCTSKRLQNIFMKELETMNCELDTKPLYFLPWNISIEESNEFRCFVCNWNLTAISQYIWHRDVGWSDKNRESELEKLVFGVNDLLCKLKKVGDRDLPQNFVLDVYVFDGGVELLELNCFGAQMAAGSCCFNWIRDYSILHGSGESVEVRVVVAK